MEKQPVPIDTERVFKTGEQPTLVSFGGGFIFGDVSEPLTEEQTEELTALD